MRRCVSIPYLASAPRLPAFENPRFEIGINLGDFGQSIWRRVQGSGASNEHPGPAHLVPLALAERIC
jgi:hypothetical protein